MAIVYRKPKPTTKRPLIKPKGVMSEADGIPKEIPEGMSEADGPRKLTLEDMKNNFRSPSTVKRFMDHGIMYDPNHPGRFPSSRDWNMPVVKCSRRICIANYGGKCTMPSLIEIGPKGCKGYHKRPSGKKK